MKNNNKWSVLAGIVLTSEKDPQWSDLISLTTGTNIQNERENADHSNRTDSIIVEKSINKLGYRLKIRLAWDQYYAT